ncbi:MAG: ArsB/NhaD family transporter [Candidatus Gastranaerophilales bacterium]|nr:ArsB/NhaD family transporter [Candidatus Gastranaerophilales bacterium]
MDFIQNFVQQNSMYIAFAILGIAYIFIALEKIPKMTIAIIGASLTLLLGLVGSTEAFKYIDFNVLFLLVSMMIIVHISAKSGMYDWLAIEMVKLTKGKPILVLVMLAVFTAVVSAFLDNVTTVILVMPLTFVIAKQFEISPVPFLISEVLASNIGGTSTLIGDPPNIIIGSKAGLSFMDFVINLTPAIATIMVVVVGILGFWFRKEIKTKPENINKVMEIDNTKTIKNKNLMIRSLIVLALVITGFVLHDKTGLAAYVSAMAGASFMLLFEKPKEVLLNVEWNTIIFFSGLFIIIGGIEATGGIHLLANKLIEATGGDTKIASMFILWGSGIISGVVDNIPYTATMAPLISELGESMNLAPLWWALSLGACLGGNFTIVGAAANVIVSEKSAAEGHKITFMQFMKYGAVITTVALMISTVYLLIKFF